MHLFCIHWHKKTELQENTDITPSGTNHSKYSNAVQPNMWITPSLLSDDIEKEIKLVYLTIPDSEHYHSIIEIQVVSSENNTPNDSEESVFICIQRAFKSTFITVNVFHFSGFNNLSLGISILTSSLSQSLSYILLSFIRISFTLSCNNPFWWWNIFCLF
jgi:hypothetical protein